jgi:hypothetical protein
MWNILIVLIIAIIIWMFNPLANFNFKSPTQVDKKTQNEVNQVLNQTQQQVDYTRNMQYKEKTSLDNEQ